MEPGTFECRMFMWNLYVEPLWNLEPSWNLRSVECEPELYVEALWALEPLNLGEPELLRLEPLCGTLGNLVSGFGRLPQTTPQLYWKNPKLFKLLGKNEPSFFKGHSAPEISTTPGFFSFRRPPQVRWNLFMEPCGTSTFKVGTLCGTWWNLNF